MNGLSVSEQKADQNLQIDLDLNLKSKMINFNFHPCPSNTLKHSIESTKPESFQLTLKCATCTTK